MRIGDILESIFTDNEQDPETRIKIDAHGTDRKEQVCPDNNSIFSTSNSAQISPGGLKGGGNEMWESISNIKKRIDKIGSYENFYRNKVVYSSNCWMGHIGGPSVLLL